MKLTIDQLNELAELRAQRDLLELDRRAALDTLLTPEIRQQMAEIETEYAPKSDAVNGRINVLEQSVKAAVAAYGATVKGEWLQAVYAKGRAAWDDKALSGYAAAHPEIEQFHTQGAPTVSIRAR